MHLDYTTTADNDKISSLISATTKYTTTEYNTTEDTTTDHDNDYSTKYEYMAVNFNRTVGTTTKFHHNHSTTEETMIKKDAAIENNNPKSRLINGITGNPKNTHYGRKKLS